MKQRNIIRLTFERLSELLGMSDDTEIISAFVSDSDRSMEAIELVIAGPRCAKNPEGQDIDVLGAEESAVIGGKKVEPTACDECTRLQIEIERLLDCPACRDRREIRRLLHRNGLGRS